MAGLTGERRATKAIPFLWAAAVAAVVAAPWVVPGFLFGTDWSGPRRLDWPTQLSSGAPFQALLTVTSAALSAELASKVLIGGCLFVAALAAYRALPVGDFVPRAAAALIYVLNPFVYGRLHYGQFFLIAAYSVLPWVAMRIYRLLSAPNVVRALWLALGLVIVGMLTVHLLLPIALLLAMSVIFAAVYQRLNLTYLARLGYSIAVTAAVTLAASTYWLIPYLAGTGYENKVIAQVSSGDLAAYNSVPDPSLGLFPNLLGLYGFWAENVHRFPALKLFVPGWELVMVAMLVLSAIGIVYVFIVRDKTLRNLRWWVTALVIAGLVGLILEAGVAEPHVAPLVRWFDTVFPPYRGMRDSGKWASLLALVYAQLIPLGVIGIRDGLRGLLTNRSLREGRRAIVAGVALALPLYYGNGLLFGMHGEIKPSQYPAGWYAADRVMVADPRHDRALFLPWHLYLHLSFVQNVNSVIANPAPGFFSIPIVVSGDPQVPGIAPPNDHEQRTISALVASGDRSAWASTLAALRIKYIAVAKEVDWQRFEFLDQQKGLVRVADFGSIIIYRNSLLP